FQQRLHTSVAGPSAVLPSAPQASEPAVLAPPGRAVPMMWPTPATVPVLAEEARLGKPPVGPAEELHLYAGYPEAGRAMLDGTPLAQFPTTYTALQYSSGVFLVDQPAAHERVLYERLRARLHDGALEAQQVLFPATLELGATDPEWVASCLP